MGFADPIVSLAIGHDDAGRRGEWAVGWKSDGLAWPDWLADAWPAGFSSGLGRAGFNLRPLSALLPDALKNQGLPER